MAGILIVDLLAVLAYWLLVPALGLPVIIGIVAAILILIAGISSDIGYGRRGDRL